MQAVLREKRRGWLCGLLMALCLSLIPLSVSLVVVAVYVYTVVDEELDLVQGMHTDALPFFLGFVGFINCVANIFLLISLARVHRASNRSGALEMFLASIVVHLVATVFILSACTYCFVQLSRLDKDFQSGLQQAMDRYGEDPSIKRRMDILQINYACCGDSGFKDWFTVPWIPLDMLVADPRETQRQMGSDYTYVADDVPFSCCDPIVPRPCIHHHVITDHLHYDYHHLVNHTLYHTGCRQVLMNFFGYTILKGLGLLLLCVFLAQVLMAVIGRLLQTSMQDAIDRKDITGPGLGYLFTKPPPGVDLEEEKAALLDYTDEEGQGNTDRNSTAGETTDEEMRRRALVEGEPIYENLLPDDVMFGNTRGNGPPLFPSEMEDESQHNIYCDSGRRRQLEDVFIAHQGGFAQHYNHHHRQRHPDDGGSEGPPLRRAPPPYSEVGRHPGHQDRRGVAGSRAFDSLGIPLPRPGGQRARHSRYPVPPPPIPNPPRLARHGYLAC